jgi:acetyltransferase-like isoleucine patch superfamily enzyme
MVLDNAWFDKLLSRIHRRLALASTRHGAARASIGPSTILAPGARISVVDGGEVTIGANCRIDSGAIISTVGGGSIHIGDDCALSSGAVLMSFGGSISLGSFCSVNPLAVLYGHGGLNIGNFVRIASQAIIVPANHRFSDTETPICRQGETRRGIVIEDDVWVACGVRVLDGVRIGTGSILAAGAVVNRSVPPFSIVGGVPARVLKKRK